MKLRTCIQWMPHAFLVDAGVQELEAARMYASILGGPPWWGLQRLLTIPTMLTRATPAES
jgi:hypothetical protein